TPTGSRRRPARRWLTEPRSGGAERLGARDPAERERDDLFGRHGSGEEEALTQPASAFAEEVQLLDGLDPLGERHHVEAVRELEERAHDRTRLRILMHLADERPIDLEDL